MSIIGLLLVLVLVGVVLAFLPMDAGIRRIVVAIICVLVAVWLLEQLGVISTRTLGPGFTLRH